MTTGPTVPTSWIRTMPPCARFLAACAALEEAVLGGAKRRGVAATRKAVERALVRIDAANVAQATTRRSGGQRDVYLVPEPDGMALLIARMAMAQAQACLSAIDGVARDPRLPLSAGTPADAGIGERRAEALAHLVLGRRRTRRAEQRCRVQPRPHGHRPRCARTSTS